ncbi:MAG: hypothetical protein ACRDK2_09095 [Solirubrobacteraceae bacterium]
MRAVNLIPADQRSGNVRITGRSQGAAFIVIVLIAGLAILAFMYGKAHNEVSSRRSEAAKLTEQAQATEARANQLTPYASFNTLYEERVKTVSELIGTRFDWAHAFHELGRVLPRNVSLSTVAGAMGGSGSSKSTTTSAPSSSAPSSSVSSSSASSATPPGSVPTMTITGCTLSQSDVAVALSRLRLINGVSEVNLQSSTKGSSSSSNSGSGAGSCPVTFNTTVTFTALPSPPAPTPTHTTPVANPSTSVPGTLAHTQPAAAQSAPTTPVRAQAATTPSKTNGSTASSSASTHTNVSTRTVNTAGGD